MKARIYIAGQTPEMLEQLNEDLRKSESRIRRILDNAPFGAHHYELEPGERLVFVGANSAADSILGINNQQFIGKTIEEAFPALVQSEIPGIYRKVAATGIRYDDEQLDFGYGGVVGSYELHAFQPAPNFVTVFFGSINERKRAEQALQKSEDRYRGLLNAAPDEILITDLEGHMQTLSHAGLKMFGYERVEDLSGRGMIDKIVPEDRERVEQYIMMIHQGNKPGPREFRGLRADGSQVDIEVNGELAGESGSGPTGMMFIIRDITERKRIAGREQMSREVLELLNSTDISAEMFKAIILLIKKTGGFDSVCIRLRRGDAFPYFVQTGLLEEYLLAENTAAVKDGTGGICRDEDGNISLECSCGLAVLGRVTPGSPFFTPGGSSWTSKAKTRTDFPAGQNPIFHPRNDCIHYGCSSVAMIPLRSGRAVIGILQLSDRRENRFTEPEVRFYEGLGSSIGVALARKRMDEELRERTRQLESANNELESFSYSVAHDLRAPLRAMDGFSKAVLDDYTDKLDDEGRDSLNRIRAASQRMGTLIDDLIKLSRISRIKIHCQQINLSALAESCVATLLAAEPDRLVEVVIQPDINLEADLNLMRIAMMNLLGNAWKFTRKSVKARIEMGVLDDNGQTVYFIRDNGAGFDQAHADKLFGAFQRLHSTEEFEGTGIGLATVRRIIHLHGGRVWAEGKTGEGATFYFTTEGGGI